MAVFCDIPNHGVLQHSDERNLTFGNSPWIASNNARVLSVAEVLRGYKLQPEDYLILDYDPGVQKLFGVPLQHHPRKAVQEWLEARGGSILVPVNLTARCYVALEEFSEWGSGECSSDPDDLATDNDALKDSSE